MASEMKVETYTTSLNAKGFAGDNNPSDGSEIKYPTTTIGSNKVRYL